MRTITPEEFAQTRTKMGMTCQELADWLNIDGEWAQRNIRRWELGTAPIPGSVIKALELAGYLDEDNQDNASHND